MTAVPAPEHGPDAGAVWHYGDPFGEQRAAADAVVLKIGRSGGIGGKGGYPFCRECGENGGLAGRD